MQLVFHHFVINALPDQEGAQFGIFCAVIAVSILVGFILYMCNLFNCTNKKNENKDVWCGALLAKFN